MIYASRLRFCESFFQCCHFFLAHLAKGKVSFCHHLASVIRRPLTFHILIFSSKTPQTNELKLGRKHLWKVLYKECSLTEEKIFFRNQPIRNKNCLWQPCLLADQNEINNLYRGPSKDASYQVSIHYLVPIR
jgi:hypothetical protein